MKGKKISFNLIAVIVLITATLLSMFYSTGVAYAATAGYTNVLDDLHKDESFNADNYPAVADDYNLQLIQIAESTDGELLLYVYQPAAHAVFLAADTVVMSQSETAAGTASYDVTLLGSAGVFQKYRVEGLTVSSDETRYYNIFNLLRPYNVAIDPPQEGEQTVNAVENRVGQLWTAETSGDTVNYSMIYSEVAEIERKVVGFIDYLDGVTIGGSPLLGAVVGGPVSGSHTLRNFVAFSTEYPIDRLIEAELEYVLQGFTFKQCANPLCLSHKTGATYDYVKNDDKTKETKTLTADGKSSNNYNGGLKGNKYTWNDIQTTAQFISDNDNDGVALKIEAEESLDGTQWVLNFYNEQIGAEGWSSLFDNHLTWTGKSASEVMLLRLTFECDGDVLNLGVVDNKQTGGSSSFNYIKRLGNETVSFFVYIWRCVVKLFKGTASMPEFFVGLAAVVVAVALLAAVLWLIAALIHKANK